MSIHRTFLLLFLLAAVPSTGHSQTEFEDFVLTNSHCFAVANGAITVWDQKKFTKSQAFLRDTEDKILSIAKDANGEVFVGTEKGMIYNLDSDLTFNRFLSSKYYPIKYLFFNSENKLFLIVPNAVYEPRTGCHWTKFRNHTDGIIHKKKLLGVFSVKSKTYFQMPHYAFLDSKDRIWMTASFGEFGGDLQIFDTRNQKIINHEPDSINMGLFFPKSVFESSKGEIFITSGVQHFMNSGDIYRMSSDLEIVRIFRSDGPRKIDRKTGVVLDEGGLFIGPGAFDKATNTITVATDRGFYRVRIDGNEKLGTPELLVNPELTWAREALAIGASMAIKKMEYTSDGKLIFLSKKDGIGIYDGDKIMLLK